MWYKKLSYFLPFNIQAQEDSIKNKRIIKNLCCLIILIWFPGIQLRHASNNFQLIKINLFVKYLNIQLKTNNTSADTNLLIYMSYITLKTQDIVYVTGIGFGTLIDCGKFKTISLKNQNSSMRKNDSLIFDPDLFRLESDSNKSKRDSSPQVPNQPLQSKLLCDSAKNSIPVTEKKQDQVKQPKQSEQQRPKQSVQIKQVNIVSVQMDNTKFMIYTPDTNIKKTVDIIIKPFLVSKFEQIVITIQISKTIESLKKLIFQRLQQPIASYYNVRLFAVSPLFSQLSIQSKTIYQCAIKDCAKLVLQAKYAFSFEDVPKDLSQSLVLSNGSNTATSRIKKIKENNKTAQCKPQQQKNPELVKRIQQLKRTDEHKIFENLQMMLGQQQMNKLVQESNPFSPQVLAQQHRNIQNVLANQTKADEALQKQQQKTESDLKLQPQKCLEIYPNPDNCLSYLNLSYLSCKVQFGSGRHYWEYKIDKGNTETDIWIGFSRKQDKNNNRIAMAYLPLGGKKYMNKQWSQYGFNAKPSDTIGVLIEFNKRHKASITFYKNTVSCGEFQNNVQGVLIPTVGLTGDSQVTVDSRAQFPLDSFRSLR